MGAVATFNGRTAGRLGLSRQCCERQCAGRGRHSGGVELSGQIKGVCDRFALAGFDALAPDLYKGKVVPLHDLDAADRESSRSTSWTPPRSPCAFHSITRAQRRQGRPDCFLPRWRLVIGAAKVPEFAAAARRARAGTPPCSEPAFRPKRRPARGYGAVPTTKEPLT